MGLFEHRLMVKVIEKMMKRSWAQFQARVWSSCSCVFFTPKTHKD